MVVSWPSRSSQEKCFSPWPFDAERTRDAKLVYGGSRYRQSRSFHRDQQRHHAVWLDDIFAERRHPVHHLEFHHRSITQWYSWMDRNIESNGTRYRPIRFGHGDRWRFLSVPDSVASKAVPPLPVKPDFPVPATRRRRSVFISIWIKEFPSRSASQAFPWLSKAIALGHAMTIARWECHRVRFLSAHCQQRFQSYCRQVDATNAMIENIANIQFAIRGDGKAMRLIQLCSDCRATISREASDTVACDGGDDLRFVIDSSYAMVSHIDKVEVARRIPTEFIRLIEFRVNRKSTITVVALFTAAHDRLNRSIGIDTANSVVVDVAEIDTAVRPASHCVGIIELRKIAGPPSPEKPLTPVPAIVSMLSALATRGTRRGISKMLTMARLRSDSLAIVEKTSQPWIASLSSFCMGTALLWFRLIRFVIDVSKLTIGSDLVSYLLFELFDFREAFHGLSIPDQFLVTVDLEDATGSGSKRNLVDLFGKGGKKLLREPGSSKHPIALSAVMNFNTVDQSSFLPSCARAVDSDDNFRRWPRAYSALS